MSRLMSVALTEDAVRDRRKTVTRRLGWAFVKPGDTLTLCRKVMGRRKADGTVEPLVRIAEVEVVSVRREPLSSIGPGETALEGFPDMTGGAFVEFFCESMRCKPDTWVTRIEWRYLGECPRSERVDGPLHSWRFGGDDPRVVCVYCEEMRDALTGEVLRGGSDV